MRTTILAALLTLGLSPVVPARADAIPMPVELDEIQELLIGEWHEDSSVMSTGLGHSATTRTIAFGNDSVAMLYFGGISYSNDYGARAVIGTWTAERVDARTVKVKMVQSAERGTEWTLVFDGNDAFIFSDAEWSNLPPSRFSRIGARIVPNRP